MKDKDATPGPFEDAPTPEPKKDRVERAAELYEQRTGQRLAEHWRELLRCFHETKD